MRRALAVVTVVGLAACSAPEKDARTNAARAPAGADFKPVAQVLVDRCGSLDCHGSTYRNMRLFGFGAFRLDPAHQPDAPDTTQAEVDADYQSVVGLEPEIFRDVVASGGRDPSRLTFIRKGRAEEDHKGGPRLFRGDAADRCVLSWLSGTVDADTCKSAVPRLLTP